MLPASGCTEVYDEEEEKGKAIAKVVKVASTWRWPGNVDFSSGDDSVVFMVAGDGLVQHYTPFGIPATGILLNPRAELSA